MFEYIHPIAFIISFAIGIVWVYINTPAKEVVYKFPNPYNAEHTVYRDDNDQCYKYKAENTACPMDKSLILPQPVHEDFKTK
jgi:hypothetical protein